MLLASALSWTAVLAATFKAEVADLKPIDAASTSFVLRDLETLHRERVPVLADGTFEFTGLELDRMYLVSMDSDTLEIPFSYLVKPSADSPTAPEEWDIRKVRNGQPLVLLGPRVEHPLRIADYRRSELVVERPQFSLFGFFTQKSVLLSVGALVAVTYLPSWLDSIDPETMDELRKNQLGAKN